MSNADQSAFSIRTLGRITWRKCVWREGFFVETCLSHESLSLSLKLLAFLPLPSRGPQESPPLAPMPFLPNNHPLCRQHYSFISDQFLHPSGSSDFACQKIINIWIKCWWSLMSGGGNRNSSGGVCLPSKAGDLARPLALPCFSHSICVPPEWFLFYLCAI